jgi:hypothetical protein
LGVIGGVSSSYRFASAFIVRLTGIVLAALGVLVLAFAMVVLTTGAPSGVLTVGLSAAVLGWLGALVGFAVLRRSVVVGFDDVGYRVRYVRGAGVRQARWKDVEDVLAPTVEGDRCVVLRLRDGRTTTIPVDVLVGSAEDFVRDLRQHLNRGHGYRTLPTSGRRPGG